MRHKGNAPIVGVNSARVRRRAVEAVATAAVGLMLAMVAGCTNGSTSTSAAAAAAASSASSPAPSASAAAAGGAAAAARAPMAAAAGSSAAPGAGAKAAAGGARLNVGTEVQAADRSVIRTANLTLSVAVRSRNKSAADDRQAEQDAVDAAAISVRALATGPGYVSAAEGKGPTQSITLRVPAAGYSSAIDALVGIAPVISRQESTQDVTSQLVDISSRMQTMTASVNRVRALLTKADKIGDVISIESELSSREADLESLQRQQAALAGQTSLSTITVVLQGSIVGVRAAVAAVPPAARSGFVAGLTNGWHAVRKLTSAGLTVVGTLIPFVPVVAVVVLAGLFGYRRVRRGTAPILPPATGEPHAAQ